MIPKFLRVAALRRQRVVEKAAPVEDSRETLTHQHHGVRRGGRGLGHQVARLALVIDPQRLRDGAWPASDRQDFLPPAHHPVRLGKKSMTAEIHAIAAVIDGLRNSAHLSIGFEHDGLDIRPPQELERGGQPGRSGAGDDGDFFRCGLGMASTFKVRHGRACIRRTRRQS